MLASRTQCKKFYGNLPEFVNKFRVGNKVQFVDKVTINEIFDQKRVSLYMVMSNYGM